VSWTLAFLASPEPEIVMFESTGPPASGLIVKTPIFGLMVAAAASGPGSGATPGIFGVGIETLLTVGAVVVLVSPLLTPASNATGTTAAASPRAAIHPILLVMLILLMSFPLQPGLSTVLSPEVAPCNFVHQLHKPERTVFETHPLGLALLSSTSKSLINPLEQRSA
jgi:hypothetical protein